MLSMPFKQLLERCCKLGHQFRIFGGFHCVSTSLDRDLHRKKSPELGNDPSFELGNDASFELGNDARQHICDNS